MRRRPSAVLFYPDARAEWMDRSTGVRSGSVRASIRARGGGDPMDEVRGVEVDD